MDLKTSRDNIELQKAWKAFTCSQECEVKKQKVFQKGFTSAENRDIIKGWVTTEDGDRIYISGGSAYGGASGYAQYQADLSTGDYTPTPSAGAKSNTESSSSTAISEVREDLEEAGIEAREVSKLDSQPSENDIISKVSGSNTAAGSCSSLALAFMAQENGLDVLDGRGGESQWFFSKTGNIVRLAEIDGVESIVEKTFNEQETTLRLVGECEEGKNYYLAVGKHAAIVRNTESGAQYLELQDRRDKNGWYPLNKSSLKSRFEATQSRSVAGHKLQTSVVLIKSESLRGNEEYKNVMSYINTAEDSQKKGTGGYAK